MTTLETLTQIAQTILTTRTGLVVNPATVTITMVEQEKGNAAGTCSHAHAGGYHITVNRGVHKDEAEIVYTLIHELIHAAVGLDAGHNRTFQKYSKLAGFYGIKKGEETITLMRDVYAALGWELKRRVA